MRASPSATDRDRVLHAPAVRPRRAPPLPSRVLCGASCPCALPMPAPPGASPAAACTTSSSKIQTTQGKIGRTKGTERVLTTQISALHRQRIGRLQAQIGTPRSAARRSVAGRPRRQARRADRHPGATCAAERARLVRLRARLAPGARGARPAARRALPGRQARPRHRDPQLQRLRRPARARRVHAAHLRAGPARSSTSCTTPRPTRTATAARLDELERRQQRVTAIVLQRRNEIAARQAGPHRHARRLDGTRADKQRALGTRARRAPAARGRRCRRSRPSRRKIQAHAAAGARARCPPGRSSAATAA